MAEPVTWLTAEGLKAEVQRITATNDYLTDIGDGEIVLDRSHLKLGNVPVTLIVVGDVVPKDNGQGKGVLNSEMDISLEVAVPYGVENPELIAHRARADLVRMLLSLANRFVPGLGSLLITGSSFDGGATDAGISFTLAQVTARAGLTETYSLAE